MLILKAVCVVLLVTVGALAYMLYSAFDTKDDRGFDDVE